ncbi:sialate O-acetylesterase [Arenibacter nanhaiticus]|uniref:Sialate O-acetylesterase n=1 Tax=Arenibacter nanhaiticus TaxID=558155 RepID=A0A1M6GBB3_9FLAO|nr:GDSL-type esterase/lipase family protein [Arenibacter nanhaiticus]SHJ07184.1 sialate O-acetylesterase [Arenibacter nanhaiticus]
MRNLVWIGFFLFFSLQAQKVKVACVGNSVTYGTGVEQREVNSYPYRLQELLGDDYEVMNFGYPGATLLKNGHKPYWEKPVFEASKSFMPNLVIIHLGLNDQGNNNWPDHKEEFVQDYLDFIQAYRDLPSRPKVVISKMSPSFSGHHWFEEGMRENYQEIQAKIEIVKDLAGVDVIDLHEPLYRFPEYYADDLHPAKEGAAIIANKMYRYISGDYGGIKLPLLFGENMVFQRNQPIVVHGSANALDEMIVTFNGELQQTKVSVHGEWSVQFASHKAGGPYKLIIDSKKSGAVKFNEVYVGEVWLASGQSNMDFKVRDDEQGHTILKDSLNPDVFLFSMDAKAQTSDHSFSKEELQNCNAANYFEASGWNKASGEKLANFSAVAYSYAYHLQKQLNVPVGIICNAVGGATTQSWISREAMETTHETISLLNDTHLHPLVQPWVNERKEKNMQNMRELGVKARHPFDPTMLFDAGINPIKNYPIKGVIWYQGESNAERAQLHSRLFKLLVSDWRNHWNNPDMPFNFVQLSSINRPGWGAFRDSQRKLLAIPNTGMVVSSDVGHPTDVHPKQKWVLGNRLAKTALAKNYGMNIPYSGSLFDFVNVKDDTLEVHFLFKEGLTTADGDELRDIQIAGADKVFFPAKARIRKNVLLLTSKKIKNPRYVRYGYTSYTDGNLTNKGRLPTATFSNLTN